MEAFTRRLMMGTALATIGSLFMARIARGAQRRADLVITALQWSDNYGLTWHNESVPAQSNVLFRAAVRNAGTAAFPPPQLIRVDFQVNGRLVAWSDTYRSGLSPGASTLLVANTGPYGDDAVWSDAPAGTHTIMARVDPLNSYKELKDGNNTRRAKLTVDPPANSLPDVVVTAVRWSEDDGATWHTGPIQAGRNVWFEADVKNQGTRPTPDRVIIGVAFLVNGVYRSWSDTHTASLPAGQTISLRANGGPDGDKYWNNAPIGSHTVRAWVDDINRIPNELDETNNTLDLPITVQGAPVSAEAVGPRTGGGNIHRFHFPGEAFRVTDLIGLHCGRARVALSPTEYFSGGAVSPALADTVMTSLLGNGIKPLIIFEWYAYFSPPPNKNYSDWFSIGQAFATRFRPNSSFLTGQKITNIGVTEYQAINEPDDPGGEVAGLTYAQYHAMLEGLADGVHSVDATAKVYPAGYLSANRDSEYTGHGYLSTVADLINDGTLAGFDLHCYHQQFAPLGNIYNRCPQHDYDACISACGITRSDLDLISTEWNAAGGTFPAAGGYDLELWYMQLFFNMQGLVRPNGSLAPGVRLPWHIWRPQHAANDMCSQLNPRVETPHGIFFRRIMEHVHDMTFVSADPRGTGVYKLTGGGKTAWAWQNHQNWTTINSGTGTTFTISDIPAGTTQVTVWDGNAVSAQSPNQTVSVPTLQIPQHTFTGLSQRCWMFIANAAEGLVT